MASLANNSLKRVLTSCRSTSKIRWPLAARYGQRPGCQIRLYGNGTDAGGAETVAKTYEKFFNIPKGGKINRHTMIAYSQKLKANIEKIDRYEAFFLHASSMHVINEYYGLSKFPEEGGKEYTPQELVQVLKGIPKDTTVFVATLVARALFRAIDTNRDGYISRKEWATYLKIQGSYESDEQATQAFDSIDLNKDGRLSMQELENMTIKFWQSVGSNEGTENMYGTQ